MKEKLGVVNNNELSEGELLREKILEFKEVADGIGREMDEKIIEVVAKFNIAGFYTVASCEGHCGEEPGHGAPWVDFSVENEPEERFLLNEEEVFNKVARKYEVPVEHVKNGENEKACEEAWQLILSGGEIPEFIKWKEEVEKLEKKIKELLAAFYENRNVEESLRLKIEPIFGLVRVHNGGDDYDREIIKETSEEEVKLHQERLQKYRKEFMDFADSVLNEKVA